MNKNSKDINKVLLFFGHSSMSTGMEFCATWRANWTGMLIEIIEMIVQISLVTNWHAKSKTIILIIRIRMPIRWRRDQANLNNHFDYLDWHASPIGAPIGALSCAEFHPSSRFPVWWNVTRFITIQFFSFFFFLWSQWKKERDRAHPLHVMLDNKRTAPNEIKMVILIAIWHYLASSSLFNFEWQQRDKKHAHTQLPILFHSLTHFSSFYFAFYLWEVPLVEVWGKRFSWKFCLFSETDKR